MIHYNMRYRGPYEQEKFLLNIMQYTNLMNSLAYDAEHTDSWKTLKELVDLVNKKFEDMTGPKGTAEKIYKNFILMRGE